MPLTLLFSAPVDPRGYAGAALSLGSYRAVQPLFGFDAQLACLADYAAQADCPCYFLPAPEIFSTPPSFARLLDTLGTADAKCVHLRFGPVRCQRVLKGVPTVAVLAEAGRQPPVNLGRHPFAGGDRLPAVCARVLVFDPGMPALRTPLGQAVPSSIIPDGVAWSDLPRLPDRPGPRDSRPAVVQIQSLAAFDVAAWSDAPRPGTQSSFDDSGKVRPRERAGQCGGEQPLLMIPWNTAYPCSIVPAIVEQLGRFCAWDLMSLRPVLFPYNLCYDFQVQLTRDITALRAAVAASPMAADRILLGRLLDVGAADTLAAMFPTAWIDDGDPESNFNCLRLAQLGIQCIRIRQPGTPPPAPSRWEVAADLECDIRIDDGFGPRLYRAAIPSVQVLARLIRLTAEHRDPIDGQSLLPDRASETRQHFFDDLARDATAVVVVP